MSSLKEDAPSEKLEKVNPDFNEKDYIDTLPFDDVDKLDDFSEQDTKKLHNEEDLEIAIVNDVALTEDDTSLRPVTVRSIFIGVVSGFLLFDPRNTDHSTDVGMSQFIDITTHGVQACGYSTY